MERIDGFSRQGARVLAERIRAYWSVRGKSPKVWVEQVTTGKASWWQVRSDMVNGVPTSATDAES